MKKKLMVLNYEFYPVGGGGGKATRQVCDRLVPKYDITVITSLCKGLKLKERLGGYSVIRVPVLRFNYSQSSLLQMFLYVLGASFILSYYCLYKRPDLIHCHFAVPTGFLGLYAKKLFGIPYVLTIRGASIPSVAAFCGGKIFNQFFSIIKPLTIPVWKNAMNITCLSAFLKQLIYKDYPFAQVSIINNGTDLDFYYPKEKPPSKKTRFIFVGRFSREKNLLSILPEFSKHPDWELNLVGNGQQRDEIVNRVNFHNMSNRVTFHGWQSKEFIREQLWKNDVMIVPSLVETFCLSALEAIACGIPVVSLEIPSLVEMFNNTAYGMTVKSWDELPEILPKIKALKYDRHKLDMYSWDKVTQQYSNLYEHALTK